MAIEATFRAETAADLIEQVKAFVGAVIGGAPAGSAAKTETEAASSDKPATRGRGKKAEEAQELRRAVGTTATVVEATETAEEANDDDPLGEAADETLDAPTITREELTALLVKVKNAFPKKPSLIGDLVKKFGGAAKLADVPEEKYALIAEEANKQLASAK